MSSGMPALSAEERDQLDGLVERFRGRPGALLTILERVQQQTEGRYLPRPTLEYVGGALRLPLSEIRSVATFYSFFNLEPQGRHTVCICRGTACHTRGSRELLDLLRESFGLHADESEAERPLTTPDGEVTVRTVACIGQCALAPVVEIDSDIYGHMNESRLKAVLAELPQEVRR